MTPSQPLWTSDDTCPGASGQWKIRLDPFHRRLTSVVPVNRSLHQTSVPGQSLWADLTSCHTISYAVKILACTSTSLVPTYSYFTLMLTSPGFRTIFMSMIYNPIPEDSGVRWNSYSKVLYLIMSTNSWGLFQKILVSKIAPLNSQSRSTPVVPGSRPTCTLTQSQILPT